MKVVNIKYIGTVGLLTGRLSETIEIKEMNLIELINELDNRYDGFRKMFLESKENKREGLKRLTYLRKSEEPTRVLLDLDYQLEEGDTIVFW
ncbi:MAG: hypothetical protein ACOC40_02230 [Thermoplasmatota archaeon]